MSDQQRPPLEVHVGDTQVQDLGLAEASERRNGDQVGVAPSDSHGMARTAQPSFGLRYQTLDIGYRIVSWKTVGLAELQPKPVP